jgi:hypothetical protein
MDNLDRMRELAGVNPVQENTTVVGTMYEIRDKLTESHDTSADCGCEDTCDCTHDLDEAKKPDADGDGIPDWADDKNDVELDESAEGRPYVAVHAKKGKIDVSGTSSYGAAQAAAKKWGLQSTAGIDVYLSDVTHVATESQQMREWANSVYKNMDDRGHIQAQPEGETVDNSLRRYLNADPAHVKIQEGYTPTGLTSEYKKFTDR